MKVRRSLDYADWLNQLLIVNSDGLFYPHLAIVGAASTTKVAATPDCLATILCAGSTHKHTSAAHLIGRRATFGLDDRDLQLNETESDSSSHDRNTYPVQDSPLHVFILLIPISQTFDKAK